VIAEVDMEPVPVPVSISVRIDSNEAGGILRAVAVVPVAVTVAAPSSGRDRGEQDDRSAQVVLDGICKEDRAEEQAGERESIRDPVPSAPDLRL